ncbi:MAG: DNA polymerase III subunit gamma/tau [Pseudomonadota bacterium]
MTTQIGKPMTQKAYTVLARRYRPTRLADLVGQDLLQSTLTEAIQQNHLPHAILLHGIRGVGKTTTARIIARALNCIGEDGKGSVTPNPCGVCTSCLDISADRHLDVIEMDAASRTGVDDVREIIESSRYKAVKGRFKIFIIDEVHMLSKSAFNALLKTLEEPPAHVKFIFATTEIRKIPDTILSRCMRFDLKRIEPAVILSYIADLCRQEGITASNEALGHIARAGDGSMRDALSLLDQAIALSLSNNAAGVTETLVRQMLGATDRSHLFSLLKALFEGRTDDLLTLTNTLFHDGIDPLLLMQELLEGIYWLTCLKTLPKMKDDLTWPQEDRNQGCALLDNLGLASLARAWQVLSKGYEEIQKNPLQKQACQMVLIRFCHMNTLPSIDKIIETMTYGENQNNSSSKLAGGAPSSASSLSATTSSPATRIVAQEAHLQAVDASINQGHVNNLPQSFEALVALLHEKRDLLLAAHLTHDVRVTHYCVGEITLNMDMTRLGHVPAQLRIALKKHTDIDWILHVTSDVSGRTIADIQKEALLFKIDQAKDDPFLKDFLNALPHATLTLMEQNYARN